MTAAKQALPVVIKLIAPAPLVDDYAELAALREAFAPTERRFQKARAQLTALVADSDPTASYLAQGVKHVVEISPCSFERSVDVPEARRKLGTARFLEIAGVTFKALSQWLTQPEIDDLTIKEQTGHRTFTPRPKSPA